jgi:hypothetical protein
MEKEKVAWEKEKGAREKAKVARGKAKVARAKAKEARAKAKGSHTRAAAQMAGIPSRSRISSFPPPCRLGPGTTAPTAFLPRTFGQVI